MFIRLIFSVTEHIRGAWQLIVWYIMQRMAYYNKIGLLILNDDESKFLVCQKYKQNVTDEYIMPGGKNDEGDDIECLKNEISQELSCEIDLSTLSYIGEYRDVAAGFSDRDVEIRLYRGRIIGAPIPSSEIEALYWIGKSDRNNNKVSRIIRNKIIPELVTRNILK